MSAIPIVLSEEDHSFKLDENALSKLLSDDRIKNRRVVVVSVAGAYRKGKSFLLGFILRYLNAKDKSNWLGDPNEPLKGFPWKGGAERNTSGILMWSEPFIVNLPSNEEVCILVMDTQGAFDSESTVKECATVFALSTMLSSIQVFNLTGNIQEDDLQHLELFTEYGRLAMESTSAKPFQHLHFLVRDWQYPYQHSYGTKGGDDLLEKRLEMAKGQHAELTKLRKHLRKCFIDIDCFLMPHPGLKVATNQHFDGRLSDIEEDFKVYVKEFIEELFDINRLVVKEINGSKLKGKDLIEYFKAYIKIYQGNDLPEPKSMLQATAEANNLTAVSRAKEKYNKEMEKVCGGDLPYVNPDIIAKEHARCKQFALDAFNQSKKMGGEEFSREYLNKLELDLEECFDIHMKNNAAKNLYASVQTPIIIFAICVILYILSGLFAMFGIESVAYILNILMLVILCVLLAWLYCRITGTFPNISTQIDHVTGQIHQVAFKNFTAHPVEKKEN